MKKSFKYFVLEIIPVMIGVFLAFLVTDCAQERSREKELDALMTNIRAEVEQNQEKVQNVLKYHRMLADTARAYLRQAEHGKKPDFFRGLQTQNLSASAYETGLQTGLLNKLPLSTLQELNTVYNTQNSYNEYNRLILERFMNIDFSDSEASYNQVLTFLDIAMNDLYRLEAYLVRQFEEYLEENGDLEV